jgi:hypothetical protein
MNHHDGRMAAAEQDDADGVQSCGGGAGSVRIPSPSWNTYNGLTATTASVRGCFGLEAASAALAGNGGHSSDHRSVSTERAEDRHV